MALPTRPTAPTNKKRLSDDALNALASRMANAQNVQQPSGAMAAAAPVAAAKAKAPVASETRTDIADKLRPAGGWSPKPTTPVAGAAQGESSLDRLARLRAEQDRVTEATKADLAAGKAKASLDAGARAGAAGMGLSGATAALQSDIGRQQDRGAVLALDDLARRQADEEFQAIGQQAAIYDYEDAYDLDMDGDGMVGGQKVGGKVGDGDPENDPKQKPKDAEDAKRAIEAAKAQLSTRDLYAGDPDTAGGTKEEPYQFNSMAEFAKWFRDTTGMEPQLKTTDYGQYAGMVVFVDQFGNYYTVPGSSGAQG